MIKRIRNNCKPTTVLLIVGFSFSFLSVLIGISVIEAIITQINNLNLDLPIFQTMQNTGISLALSIYSFSIVSCLVVTNYWIITKRREMAIRKAFGWTNHDLIVFISKRMGLLLLLALGISSILLLFVTEMDVLPIQLKITPFFVLGTMLLLLVTLLFSISIPAYRIMKIQPAEVIS